MTPEQTEERISYWLKTAKHDYKTMSALFSGKRYSDCLFFGHIVLEKALKACVVRQTEEDPPKIHDLIRLSEMAELDLSEDDLDYFDLVNDFNIRARYPEYRLKFYKLCTKNFTQKHLKKITELYKNLCQKLKQKK
ncbi:MAG: HEPN domain-containing protein [Patescibacteria group bacterium]